MNQRPDPPGELPLDPPGAVLFQETSQGACFGGGGGVEHVAADFCEECVLFFFFWTCFLFARIGVFALFVLAADLLAVASLTFSFPRRRFPPGTGLVFEFALVPCIKKSRPRLDRPPRWSSS